MRKAAENRGDGRIGRVLPLNLVQSSFVMLSNYVCTGIRARDKFDGCKHNQGATAGGGHSESSFSTSCVYFIFVCSLAPRFLRYERSTSVHYYAATDCEELFRLPVSLRKPIRHQRPRLGHVECG